MTTLQRNSLGERNVEQAIRALKRGSYLLKYGRRGKPKLCRFSLSSDETTLIWCEGKEEKHLQLSLVSTIISGQRTATFQKWPQLDKQYLSFSLLFGKSSLDLKQAEGAIVLVLMKEKVLDAEILPGSKDKEALIYKICKDKDEAETWFIALRALIIRTNCQKWKAETKGDCTPSESFNAEKSGNQTIVVPSGSRPQKSLGRVFSEILLYNPETHCSPHRESESPYANFDDPSARSSDDTLRSSFSSVLSISSQGSNFDNLDSLYDLYLWGEGTDHGLLVGTVNNIGNLRASRKDTFMPKVMESALFLDAQSVACGSKHAVLVTKNGEIFSWGEGSGGKLGHGADFSVTDPMLIERISKLNVKSVACGYYHTCAVTFTGDLYTWGDGTHNMGLLGHGNELGYWLPKKVEGPIDGYRISFVSCGPWHSAIVSSEGQLFTFGDGTFGALGHGDRSSIFFPRQVETLKGKRTLAISCGFWHTAAVVEEIEAACSNSSIGKIFSWGNGDEGQLGHGDTISRLYPSCITLLDDNNFCQVACGCNITVALTMSGQVYTMGSGYSEQFGNRETSCKPTCVHGDMKHSFIEEIACGSSHIVALSSNSELYTWGKGTQGQLGHGDSDDRSSPTRVEALKGRRIKSVVCGNNFTAAICFHRQMSFADQCTCSGCHSQFNFRRRRHNCYNCGLVFCKACSSRKSLKASFASQQTRTYRVCDDCFTKLNKRLDAGLSCLPPKASSGQTVKDPCDLEGKDHPKSKRKGLLSRLSTFDFRRSDSRKPRQSEKVKSGSFNASSLRKAHSFSYTSYESSASTSAVNYTAKTSASVPASSSHSQSASPLSVISTPSRSLSIACAFAALECPEVAYDGSEEISDSLLREISILKEQVKVLDKRSQCLEAELEQTSRELKETMDLAKEEAERSNAAKEAIKSLTMQLNKMSLGDPPSSSYGRNLDVMAESGFTVLNFSTQSQLIN